MSSRASPSESIHNIEEDDDEFDWEAAVREIDVACEGVALATETRAEEQRFADPRVLGNEAAPGVYRCKAKRSSGTRQSTLDKFINAAGRRPGFENDSLGRRGAVDVACGGIEGSSGNDGGGGDGDAACYCDIDLEAAKTWIYPVNIPLRDYQLSITKTALFSNTLVALPTGLGKTLIAAVVMYNYFRWFPTGKIVFTAPSRPLVLQQIEACHNIVGIPQEWTIDMTGQISPSNRAQFWETKRVFFVTPQVLEKDIQSGTCFVKQLVCLVIDEAHRALGNFSYCVAVRELLAVPVHLRILALTATPGSKQQTIQNVINNLQISKLEYRNESDHDVSPYVHNRKLELIQVAMGKDAVEINNLLLEAIKPFVARLCAFGLLHNRDFQTLSPCDLLNSRDKFRQAPPLNLPQIRYGEVEGYFGVLITLYHIRKLLSSHGIRPAYEMLEEKLQQGFFSRFMSRNEVIWKAKLVMQQSLSHGAPSPKLSKMIEILTDHFKTKNPKSSRVIIFSNFRGSVRDIMESLSNIGDIVKATEFIGQSSGKALKGQSQKVQQAVLQKFRAGGYNVIVATSIGEEGLDIMEVDLVICFDANVSPLRMIQRMGRTGRKHDGRVVVLACEGSELKGYLRKQANSKAVRKHMRNGGMNSFDFHPSPRMIPHICKPDVQFVELSIEQFVPRGRKVKSDQMQRLALKDKISDSEAELVAKYFHSSRENTWKPSLVAFPHFQAFPSRVHKVIHSFRTGMLIDTIQQLQGLSFCDDSEILQVQVEGRPSGLCLEAETVGHDDQSEEDLINDSPKAHSQRKFSDLDSPPAVVSNCEEKHCMTNTSGHSFLFGSEFVSLDAFGMVSILYVPAVPFEKESSHCKTIEAKRIPFPSITSFEDHDEFKAQAKAIEKITGPDEASCCINHDVVLFPSFCNSEPYEEKTLVGVERTVLQTRSPKAYLINSADHIVDTPASVREKTPMLLAKESTNDFKDIEMSPRLTNMVEKGVVPESPIDLQEKSMPTTKTHSMELPNYGLSNELGTSVHVSFTKLCNGLPPEELSSDRNQNVKIYDSACSRGYNSVSPVNEKIQSPLVEITSCINASHLSGSPVNDEIHTPFVNLTNSCSKDWHLSSGEASKSIQQVPKLKRLRKYRESCKRMSSKTMKENVNGSSVSLSRSLAGTRPGRIKHTKAKQKRGLQVELFIENEAEVSSDAEVSDDEEEDKVCNSYDDSFIDDRTNPEAASTQAEASGCDMMAIYRRSLLSQSPMVNQPNCSNDFSPDAMLCTVKLDESRRSRKINHSIRTYQTGLQSPNQCAVRSSTSCQMDPDRIFLVAMPGETNATTREEGRTMESRKRKPSFHQGGYGPTSSIQPKRLFQQEGFENSSLQSQDNNNQLNIDLLSDDQFYEGLDLDALEAEATERLRRNSVSPMEKKQWSIPNPFADENIGTVNSPSFDLGI